MILLISTCTEKFHEKEFVKPIEKTLKENKIKFFTRHYKKIKKGDFKNAKKIIICGTSLQDDRYLKDINYFLWIKNFDKPILGICSGMQIISLVFEIEKQVKKLDIKNNLDHVIKKKTEIGYYFEFFKKPFLSLENEHEVYHLHNNYVTLPNNFVKFTSSKIPQAIKHKEKEIYGVLFHPEVRNRKLIEEFIKI